MESVTRYGLMQLLLFLLLSSLLHLGLLVWLPDLTRYFNIHLPPLVPANRLLEVELIAKKPPSLRPLSRSIPKLPAVPEPESGKRLAALIESRLRQLEPLPALGDVPLLPAAPLELPVTARPDPAALDSLLLFPTAPAANADERLGRMNNQAFGELCGRRRARLASAPHAAGSPVAALLPAAARSRLLRLTRPDRPARTKVFALSGPVARQRRVLYRPPLPRVALAREVVVKLRFWVRPDGTVSRVETDRIDDLELVNAAGSYLQQWRFSVLPSEAPQIEQWGRLTMIFRVAE